MEPIALPVDPPPGIRPHLGWRVRPDMMPRLSALRRALQIQAFIEGGDPGKVTFTDIVEEALVIGVRAVGARIEAASGMDGLPSTEDEWRRFERALRRAFRAVRQAQSTEAREAP